MAIFGAYSIISIVKPERFSIWGYGWTRQLARAQEAHLEAEYLRCHSDCVEDGFRLRRLACLARLDEAFASAEQDLVDSENLLPRDIRKRRLSSL